MTNFAEIRARAAERKGGDAALHSLLGAAPDNAALSPRLRTTASCRPLPSVFSPRASFGG